jgi:hypothetical protein
MLDDIRSTAPGDAEVIDRLAEARVFFYDGPGVILPSGRRVSGEEMRGLVAEAGYVPLARDGERNDPALPKYWGHDTPPVPARADVLRESARRAHAKGVISAAELDDRLRRIAFMEEQDSEGG